MNVISRRVDSGLGAWTHSEWQPETGHPLSWTVRGIWDFDGRMTHRRERVFPSGTVELIVQLDDRYHEVEGAGTRLTPFTCITGLRTGPMVIEAPLQRCRVLGVSLRPLGAWALLEHPLSDLTDVTADLRDLLGSHATALAERCGDSESASERIRWTVAWLCDRLRRSSAVPRLSLPVARIAARIADTGGAVRIGRLRADQGPTAGRLTAAFLEQIGITPKRYARIHRFRRALGMLEHGQAGLSRVALRAGYYDQSHMNAEFREMAGLTPRQFLTAARYPSSTSLAEG